MNKTIAASLFAFALLPATPGFAADMYAAGAKDSLLPVAATGPVNWTGFYLGINGGYGESASSRDFTATGVWARDANNTYTGKGDIAGPTSTGFLFGGQVGYLNQTSLGIVIGGEFAFDGSSIDGSKDSTANAATVHNWNYPATADTAADVGSATGTVTGIPTSVSQKLNWVGGLTGIVGLPMGNALVYAKGGLAFGNIETAIASGGAGGILASRNDTETGWTAGLGVAYKFTPNWSFGVEGDYYDFGGRSFSANYVGDGSTFSTEHPLKVSTSSVAQDFYTIKGVLNYQVGGTYASLK